MQVGNVYLFSADYVISTGNTVSPCSQKAHGLNEKIDVKKIPQVFSSVVRNQENKIGHCDMKENLYKI